MPTESALPRCLLLSIYNFHILHLDSHTAHLTLACAATSLASVNPLLLSRYKSTALQCTPYIALLCLFQGAIYSLEGS